jgi:hypothetical protein
MKVRNIIAIVILLVPVAIAIAIGFKPITGTVTCSWGHSIITSEIKGFTVNPPLVLFLGALVYGFYRDNLAFFAASAISFLYAFLMLWLVWSGARGELPGVLFYAAIFAFIGLVGAFIAHLVYSMFVRIFTKK